jgi:hypothetical protein
MPISGNHWRWTAGASHSAIVASPIWQDHNDDATTAFGIHAKQPDSAGRIRPTSGNLSHSRLIAGNSAGNAVRKPSRLPGSRHPQHSEWLRWRLNREAHARYAATCRNDVRRRILSITSDGCKEIAADSERGLSPVTGNGDIEGHRTMKAEFQRAACHRTPGSTALTEGWLWYLDGWRTGS